MMGTSEMVKENFIPKRFLNYVVHKEKGTLEGQ